MPKLYLLSFLLIVTLVLVGIYFISYLYVRVDHQWPGKYAYYRYYSVYYFYYPFFSIDRQLTGVESIEPLDDRWFPSNAR
jgi:hypothetical protein